MVFTILLASLFNSVMSKLQDIRYGARIADSELRHPPLFILGHWRSGTTLLHELLSLDDRLRAPTTFECLSPTTCLVTGAMRRFKFLIPAKRPMDAMDFGWDLPQEDEIALMNMGLPSIYRQVAFPNNPPIDRQSLDFSDVSGSERQEWLEGLRKFVKLVALRDPSRRVVLKSPQHLGRVSAILEAFPDAIFVHIVRDPYRVFPSTLRLCVALAETQALQVARYDSLEDDVLSCFEQMYEGFMRDRHLIERGKLFEIRYEGLVADPAEQLEALYDTLELGDFDRVRPAVRAYFSTRSNYRVNDLETDDTQRFEVGRRWGRFMRHYGYCLDHFGSTGSVTPMQRELLPSTS